MKEKQYLSSVVTQIENQIDVNQLMYELVTKYMNGYVCIWTEYTTLVMEHRCVPRLVINVLVDEVSGHGSVISHFPSSNPTETPKFVA